MIVQLLFHMYLILREEDTILERVEGGVNLFKQQKTGTTEEGGRVEVGEGGRRSKVLHGTAEWGREGGREGVREGVRMAGW